MNLRVQIPGGTNALTTCALKSPTHESDEESRAPNDIKYRAGGRWILVPDDPIIAVVKVLPKGAVQLPLEVRERLGLKPGTKLIVAATEDALVMRRAEILLRQPSRVS